MFALFAIAMLAVSSVVSPKIPTTDYVPGTKVEYRAQIDNGTLDCAWSYDCLRGQPLLHTYPFEILHRTGGWAETGDWKGSFKREIVWEVVLNHFDNTIPGINWGQVAASDMAVTLLAVGFRPILGPYTPQNGLPIYALGQRYKKSTAFVLAYYGANMDVEAVTVYDTGKPWEEREAKELLAKQVMDAIAAG